MPFNQSLRTQGISTERKTAVMTAKTTGRIFNIQRYSIHDGFGIRTLVFLKGCPMACQWCANPESQKSWPELGFIASKCVGIDTCGGPCVKACSEEAVALDEQGKPVVDRRGCNNCGACAEVCYYGALQLMGREMSINEVMAEVEKDRCFYRRSSGGITIGGGEPLVQFEFTTELLKAAHEQYLHAAIETCGHVPWQYFEKVLRHVDLLYCDIKHMDPEKHQKLTGQSNELILDNLKKVLSVKAPQDVIIRIPIIPGCNDSVENISASARFIADSGLKQIELVPYHKLGISKYSQYGMAYQLDACEPPTKADFQRFRDVVESFGLEEMTGRI
jgi:pyruvate formate lyase activating enzyme